MAMLNLLVILCALAATVRCVWVGMHANAIDPDEDRLTRAANARDRGATGLPDYAAAAVLFATACACAVHIVSPVVGYALSCLALTSRSMAILLFEERERARRRRAALLEPAPRVDPVLLIWIALAASSTLLILPSLSAGSNRVSAIAVAGCCIAMVLLAWRLATAPRLLSGEDVEAELLLDRMRRIRRTGLTCIVAVGCASFYAVISTGSINVYAIGYGVWFALIVWMVVYLRIASRTLVLS